MVVVHHASTTYELVHLQALPHLAALPTHCLKTRGTVPHLISLVKLIETVFEIVLLEERVEFDRSKCEFWGC